MGGENVYTTPFMNQDSYEQSRPSWHFCISTLTFELVVFLNLLASILFRRFPQNEKIIVSEHSQSNKWPVLWLFRWGLYSNLVCLGKRGHCLVKGAIVYIIYSFQCNYMYIYLLIPLQLYWPSQFVGLEPYLCSQWSEWMYTSFKVGH